MMQSLGSLAIQSAFIRGVCASVSTVGATGKSLGLVMLVLAMQFSGAAIAADDNNKNESQASEPEADATVGAEQMRALLTLARATDRNVMVVFGADWCDRCVLLNRYMEESELQQRIADRFVVMHVDVGYWDKHRQYEAQMGHPTREGLPAVVIADAEEDYSNIMQSDELVTFLPDRDQPIYDWMDRVLTYAEQTYAVR